MLKFFGLMLIVGIVVFEGGAFADVIYLKNGRSMRGIIEKEDKKTILLNVGVGKISLKKEEISRIEGANDDGRKEIESEWQRKYFFHPEYAPPQLKKFATEFLKLKQQRVLAVKSANQAKDLKDKRQKLDQDNTQLNKKLVSLSRELNGSSPKSNPSRYNKLVSEYNGLVAGIQVNRSDSEALDQEFKSLDKQISTYITAMKNFKQALADKLAQYASAKTDAQWIYLDSLDQQLQKLNDDFSYHRVSYKNNQGSMVVDAVLNGSNRARLIVDTGASLVMLTQSLAERLGIKLDKQKVFNAVLADGTQVKAYHLFLTSVSVGDVFLKDVEAAVVENKAEIGADGLLGMSFLKNFIVSFDGKTNSLILEEFVPQ